MGDPYVDPRSGVLRNRLGLTDEESLRAAETDISTAAIFALEMSPNLGEGHFDFAHLRALHVRIFGEVYAWAGKPRTVDIAKGSYFCLARNIDEFAASVFRELADESYLVGLARSDLVKRLAALYGQLNALHPFREGNGRTQRAFLTALGRLGGWSVRWSDLDRETNVEASRRSLDSGDDTWLERMLDPLVELTSPASGEVTSGERRRVVLAIPQIAAEIPMEIEELRRGPYPSRTRCAVCDVEYDLADEATVVLVRPMPTSGGGGFVNYAHARCSRSRMLPPPTPQQMQEWRNQQVMEATAVALVLESTTGTQAVFAWRPDEFTLLSVRGEVIDNFLNSVISRGLRPSAVIAPPEGGPLWSLVLDGPDGAVTIRDASGDLKFAAQGIQLPPGWMEAVSASGRCLLVAVTRTELDLAGIDAAAKQGRAVVGLAEVVVADG